MKNLLKNDKTLNDLEGAFMSGRNNFDWHEASQTFADNAKQILGTDTYQKDQKGNISDADWSTMKKAIKAISGKYGVGWQGKFQNLNDFTEDVFSKIK